MAKQPKGVRLGGRAKGTPNKATDETRALIERTLGASPLEKMARLASDLLDGTREDAKANEIAARLLCALAEYCAPKRKAIELSGPHGAPVPIGHLTVEVIQSNAP